MPAGVGLTEYCRSIVDAVAPVAAVVKPQTAFFEAYGADGWAALRDVVLFWAKRGIRIFRVDNPHTKPVPF